MWAVVERVAGLGFRFRESRKGRVLKGKGDAVGCEQEE